MRLSDPSAKRTFSSPAFILFDSSTGDLFYDADGNGATAKVLFAHLTLSGMSGTFGADDFLII